MDTNSIGCIIYGCYRFVQSLLTAPWNALEEFLFSYQCVYAHTRICNVRKYVCVCFFENAPAR